MTIWVMVRFRGGGGLGRRFPYVHALLLPRALLGFTCREHSPYGPTTSTEDMLKTKKKKKNESTDKVNHVHHGSGGYSRTGRYRPSITHARRWRRKMETLLLLTLYFSFLFPLSLISSLSIPPKTCPLLTLFTWPIFPLAPLPISFFMTGISFLNNTSGPFYKYLHLLSLQGQGFVISFTSLGI